MPAMTHDPARPSTAERRPRRAKLSALGVLALVGTVLLPAGTSVAATAPGLGNAESFAVLGSTTVTNTGETVVNGDLGVSPGTAVTGFPPGVVVDGDIYAADDAADAQADAATAYGALAAQPCTQDLSGEDLGGLTLTPGVYCFDVAAGLTGALTLDASDPDDVFIFRIGTALTTGPGSSVEFLDGLASCNVFWQVGSAATLDVGTEFVGTLIALTEAITLEDEATVMGRLISLNAAVTLINNVVTATSCAAEGETTGGDTTGGTDAGTTGGDTTSGDTTATDTTGGDTTAVDTTGGDTTGGETTGGGTTGGDTTDGGTTTDLGTGGPGVPTSTTGGDVPRPELPNTGSSVVLAGLAVLAIAVGGGLVWFAGTKRSTAARHLRLTARRARRRAAMA